jgi:hypothetical protein
MTDTFTTVNKTDRKTTTDRKRLRRGNITPPSTPKLKKKVKLPPLPEFVVDTVKIDTIGGLIDVAERWEKHKEDHGINKLMLDNLDSPVILAYFDENIAYERLLWIIKELRQLDGLVGLGGLKGSIIDQIVFFVQNLQSGELMHTVFYGEQGCGKTTLAEIIAKMYSRLGILSKGTFTVARRDDFIAGYLGQTAIKTKKLLDSCIGGVLFIDEAYSLGPPKGDNDSFAKEAIDTINQFLSENYEDFICIIAGYEKNLQENFFSNNPGLDRRFPWKFSIDKYTTDELFKIFKHNFSGKWKMGVSDDCKYLFDHKEFSNNGGDCKIIFDRAKIFHGRRIFNNPTHEKYLITDEDTRMAVKDFMKNKKKKSSNPPEGIYM